MAKFAKAERQAAKAVKKNLAIGSPRHRHRNDGKIHSVRTAGHYEATYVKVGVWLKESRADHGLLKLTTAEACQFLVDQAVNHSQSSLDQMRQALECHLGTKLERIESEKRTVLGTRSYFPDQVRAISAAQAERNAISTEIADRAGLRAHELLTIRPLAEQAPSGHRSWSNDRFLKQEEWCRYTVEGTGGLIREVRLPEDLAARLEERRLAEPRIVNDRGVVYIQQYDIGGGNSWSQSFSSASKRALGFSNGGHGLRHGFVQKRMEDYQSSGYSIWDARAAVAQEVGHFSPSTTKVYER